MTDKEESEMIELILGAVQIYGSQKALAKRMDISEAYLSDIINGRRGVSQKVADFFQRQRTIIYRDAQEEAA
jgi:DNA-binding transcriptional regulator YdaS (Cro superfamily)